MLHEVQIAASILKPWLEGFVSVVALLTAGYTLYRDWFQRARVSIAAGDQMSIIRMQGGARRIHVRGVLLNAAAGKMGTLQHLEAKITNPSGAIQRYCWNEFIDYQPGSTNVQREGPAVPIAVPGRDSRSLKVQLELIEPRVHQTGSLDDTELSSSDG